MSWHCAECHAPEDSVNRVDAVCHHCGKPLCRQDQVLIPDEAFAPASGPSDRNAVHCRPCHRQFHPMAFIKLDRPRDDQ
jgi:hypothetical protein